MNDKRKIVIVLAALANACGGANAGGQSGDLSGNADNREHAAGSQCKETPEPIAGLEQVTELGFSAADVLAFSARRFESSLLWRTSSSVSFGPEAGQSNLTLDVEYTGGPVAFMRATENTDSLEDGPALATDCPSSIRIPVKVSMRTGAGALAESFEANLRATSRFGAHLGKGFELDQLQGSFAVETINPPEGMVKQFGFDAVLTPFGMSGKLDSVVEVGVGGADGVVGATFVTYASWPDSEGCAGVLGGPPGLPVALEQKLVGFSGSESLADYNAHSPAPFSWSDATTSTELHLAASAVGGGCVWLPRAFDADRGSVSFTADYPITLVAKTHDGLLDATYPGHLVVKADNSGARLKTSVEAALNVPVVEVSKLGFPKLELSQTFDSLSVSVQSELGAGKIGLTGISQAPCVTEPMPPQNNQGGSSIPGCRGSDFTTLKSGTWRSSE